MKILFWVIVLGTLLSLISCALSSGEVSDNNPNDTLSMEEIEENFDSCQFGNTLDSIAHIDK